MATLQDLISNKEQYPDGTTITLTDGVSTTLGEVRKGYMMESDYRRKTSVVSDGKRQLDQERQQFEAAKFEAEQKLEALAGRLMTREPNKGQSDLEAELAANPVARALTEQVKGLTEKLGTLEKATSTLHQELTQSKQTAMLDQHRRVLSGLKEKDPDLDEAELVSFAKNNYVPRLDLAYRLFTEDKRLKQVAEDAAKKAKEAGIEEGKRLAVAPTLPNRARMLAPGLDKDAPQTMDAAADAAAQDPEIISLLTSGIN